MKLPFSNYVKAHHISHAALSVCALVAAIVFFVVGAGIRLLVGPVSLGPLQQTLAGAIQSALPGITLYYDTAAIEWDREQDRVKLVVLGTRILDQDGKVVASAPKADIELAAAPFLQGKVAVRRITLVGVSFSLVHMKGGGIRLGAEGGRANDVYDRLSDVIYAKGSSSSTLKSFAVRDANLKLFDEVTGLNLTAPRANLSITARGTTTWPPASIPMSICRQAGRQARACEGRSDAAVRRWADHRHRHRQPSRPGRAQRQCALVPAAASAGRCPPIFRPTFSVAPGGRITETDFDLQAEGDIPFDWLRTRRCMCASCA